MPDSAPSWINDGNQDLEVARFVLEGDDYVERITRDAAHYLKVVSSHRPAGPFQSFAQAVAELEKKQRDNRDIVRKVAEAVYLQLKNECYLRYENERSFNVITGEQQIRLPNMVGELHLGTCIDLAILFLSCLANVKVWPIYVHLRSKSGGKEGVDHSMAATWVIKPPGERAALLPLKDLIKLSVDHKVLVLEPTGFVEGYPLRSNKITFKEASEEAVEKLRDNNYDGFALDVCRAWGKGIQPVACATEKDGRLQKSPRNRRPALAGGAFEEACSRYRQQCQEKWDADFRSEASPPEPGLPPYIESQVLELLADLRDPRPYLVPERFRMRRRGDVGEQCERPGPAEEDRWEAIERATLVRRLTAPLKPASGPAEEAIRLLCITHDAGQGKSALLRWLQQEIHRAAPHQLALFVENVGVLRGSWDEVMERFSQEIGPRREHRAGLEDWMRQGRVVFLLDALDQAPAGIDVSRLRNLAEGVGAQCRFVVAGRPQSVGQHWDALFQRPAGRCDWRFLLMAYFTEEQQRLYLGEEVFQAIPEDAREILGVPRALYYLRGLAEKSAAELAKVRSAGGVYYYAVKEMVRHGLQAESAHGLAMNNALLLLGAIAFEMAAERNFDRVGAGAMNAFLDKVAERRKCAPGKSGYDPSCFTEQLGRLAAMNEGLSCGLLESGCPEEIQWRNRSLQEFFAAYWMAQGCSEADGPLLWHWIYLPDDPATEDYRWVWRFAAEMPEEGCWEGAWPSALGPVYLPDRYRPPEAEGRAVKRSNEIIYRSWQGMERWPQGRAILEEFQREFRGMVKAPEHPGHAIARGLLDGLVNCPPAGSESGTPFWMGSPDGETGRFHDEDRHRVVVDPIRLGNYAVTNREYALFDPAHGERLGGVPWSSPADYGRHPAVRVSWYDAWVFCHWLGPGVRLTAEAEWEYACRAGTTTRYSFGENEEELGKYAWYGGNSGYELHPAGQKRPNRWGLFDMHGNVWEWCEDWYGPYDCRNSPSWNPRGPETGKRRVLRGGAWNHSPGLVRCAARSHLNPDVRYNYIGFRVAASPSSGL